jgi:hypothetical protein
MGRSVDCGCCGVLRPTLGAKNAPKMGHPWQVLPALLGKEGQRQTQRSRRTPRFAKEVHERTQIPCGNDRQKANADS